MKALALLVLAVGVLAQSQTQSIGIVGTITPTATAAITPPSERPLATCSADPLWRRLRNSEGVDPCTLAMNLQRTCTTIDPIVALTGGESYTGPTSVAAATPCICNTVMYNLVAGCAACQHQLSSRVSRNWVSWSTWSALCQDRSSIQDGVWNRAVLFNSTIPAWAYVKVFNSDNFDLQQAVNIGVSSTAGASSTSSPSPTSVPSNGTSTNAGVIVGATLGGVGFILLLLTILFCSLRRRQRRWEEREGVNRLDSTFVIGKPPANSGAPMVQKGPMGRYGPGGLLSPAQEEFNEKSRAVRTETALPDVISDEHRQGRPEYPMPAPTHFGGDNAGGYGPYPVQHSQYAPVANPGVAGIGAGGHGLAPAPVSRVTPKDGPSGAAAQMLASDLAAARKSREGIFREDFSAEGNGYRSSTDADGQSQHFRNGNGGTIRTAFPPSSYPYNFTRNGTGAGNGNEDAHAYSTVGDTSISIYPSSADHHTDHPPPFVGGAAPPPEKSREEHQLPDRGYSGVRNSAAMPSPPLDADPFGANRRPTAFSRVFGERGSGNMAGVGTGRGSAQGSPTTPPTAQGRGGPAAATRVGASPVLNRGPNISPSNIRRTGGIGGLTQDMGFGRQHQAAAGGYGNGGQRDSNAFSDASSPTAVGFPGDIGSARGEGSPLPTAPFAGRSGYGAER